MRNLYADKPINYGYYFQDSGSDWMKAIINLHNNIIFYLIIISIMVIWFILSALFNKDHILVEHNNNLEFIWTIIPAIILWLIGLPSIRLLYMMDEILDSEITLKVIGNQWYWSYEYNDYTNGIQFDSFLINVDDLELGELRMLTLDNYIYLPINTSIRLILTANDVIHSFAIPSLGIKCDCIPGRLNSVSMLILRTGRYYGQCSELCGALHSAMPIAINAVSLSDYLIWLNQQST